MDINSLLEMIFCFIVYVVFFWIGWKLTDYVKFRIRFYLAQFNRPENPFNDYEEQL